MRLSALVVGLALLPATAHAGGTVTFGTGSLIIPMDTTYQDSGMLKAYGLVQRLLEANVPVSWVIEPTKAHGGVDFTASATDHQSGAAIAAHGYRGGPF